MSKEIIIELTNGFFGFYFDILKKDGTMTYIEGQPNFEEWRNRYENNERQFNLVDKQEFEEMVDDYVKDLQKEFIEIEEKDFFHAYECLPPLRCKKRYGGLSFFISEEYDCGLHQFYFQDIETKKCYTGLRKVKATNEELEEMIKIFLNDSMSI